MDTLLLLSGSRLAEMIRRGEISSLEAVDAHVRHIERVNPTLNAMVAQRFDEARAEAKAADALRAASKGDGLPPFLGVPCSIKESFALAGMPFTSGLVARKGVRAERDAVGVARLRAAGAIALGVTNVSELCMWMESNNRVYGRSNNPYDRRRTVGGSSGGEGAIVGAGGTPFGLGADIGGSIRMPAFFNGVFGHKPTGGLVDNAGQYPLPAEAAMSYITTGPIARRAEDLAPLLRILADAEIADPASVEIDGLEVLSVEGDGRLGVSADLVAAQRRAAAALAARGACVRKTSFAGLSRSVEIWSAMLKEAAGPSYASMLGNGEDVSVARELVRWGLRRSPYTLPSLMLVLLEKLPGLLPDASARYLALGRDLKRELVTQIGPRGVMLYPSHPRPAPYHYQAMFPPWSWAYTAILNVMELPVTQVPLGLNAAGLPLGVQVAGVPGNDHVTIAVALELERAFGGWIPPPIAARA